MMAFSSKVQENSSAIPPKESIGRHVSFLQAHTKKNINKAVQVRELQQQMMWPSDEAMESYLRHGMIKNTELAPKDLDNAKMILGKADAPLKGKTTVASMTKDKSQQVMLQDIPGLKEIMVNLYIDLFYVNGIPFLHTKSKDLNYITIQKIDRRITSKIKKKLKNVIIR